MELGAGAHGRGADVQVGQDGGHGDGEDGAEGEAVGDEGAAGLWGRGGGVSWRKARKSGGRGVRAREG